MQEISQLKISTVGRKKRKEKQGTKKEIKIRLMEFWEKAEEGLYIEKEEKLWSCLFQQKGKMRVIDLN